MFQTQQQIPSVRALAELLDKSHTTIRRWIAREDWPFRRSPPWSRDDRPGILRWVADHLQEDRAAGWNDEAPPPPATPRVPLEEFAFVTDRDTLDESCPLSLWGTEIPEKQVFAITVEDAVAYGVALNVGVQCGIRHHSEDEGRSLPEVATDAEWRKLVVSLGTDRLMRSLAAGFAHWVEVRFKGRPEWAKWMPDDTRPGPRKRGAHGAAEARQTKGNRGERHDAN